jgi:ABC-type uncharacterized transport system permease subunit
MKEILKTVLRVSLIIIAYFLIRFVISISEGPAFGWDTAVILGVVMAILVFVIQYSVKPEKLVFTTLSFAVFFAAGSLFWVASDVATYSLQAAVVIFSLFFIYLFFHSLKSVRRKIDESIKSVG